MEPFLCKLTSVADKVFKRKNRFRAIAVSVLCAAMVSVLTGVTVASKEVYIIDGDKQIIVYTSLDKPEDILASQNIDVASDDVVEYAETGDRTYKLSVKRAFNVTVTADGKSTQLRLCEATASDALKAAGVTVGANDRVNVAFDQQLHEGSEIVVDRVSYKTIVKKYKTSFKRINRKTSSLYEGETKVVSKGSNGLVVSKSRQTLVNGEVESTEFLNRRVKKQAVNQVVLVGKAEKPPAITTIRPAGTIKLDSAGKPVKYSKCYVGTATAYTAPAGAHTASGKIVARGRVAVDPNIIPYGTRLYIKTESGYVYGYAEAADTGGAMRSGEVLVDLFYGSSSECYNFGRRQVEVYVLD